MNSCHYRAARLARRAFQTPATWGLGILTVSGVIGCASANGGMGPREPEPAGIACRDASPAPVAALPHAAREVGALDVIRPALADATPEAHMEDEPARIALPQAAMLARERAFTEASSFAAIALLAALQASAPGDPASSWRVSLDDTDGAKEVGRFFGETIADARVFGGLGFGGIDHVSKGPSDIIAASGSTPSRTTWLRSPDGRACMQSQAIASTER
jgi:hypothetical protein